MSQTLNMIKRELMTPDELKSMPKGQFIIMKTGCHPMKTRLSLYFEKEIKFDEKHPYMMPDNSNRRVLYVDRENISKGIRLAFPRTDAASGNTTKPRDTSGLKHRAIIVYLYLESRANKDGLCWPSVRLIAKELGLSTKPVYRAIDDFRNVGLSKTVQRKRRSGAWSSLLYYLNCDCAIK